MFCISTGQYKTLGSCYCQDILRHQSLSNKVYSKLFWFSLTVKFYKGTVHERKQSFEKKNQVSPIIGNYFPLVEDDYCHLQMHSNEGEQITFIIILLNQQSESV